MTEYSHTLILRSDEVMKFCVEAAVSAAQGGTAVGPPPPQVGNWTGSMKKKFSFFSLRKSTEKNFVTGKVRLLAPKPTHLVFVLMGIISVRKLTVCGLDPDTHYFCTIVLRLLFRN